MVVWCGRAISPGSLEAQWISCLDKEVNLCIVPCLVYLNISLRAPIEISSLCYIIQKHEKADHPFSQLCHNESVITSAQSSNQEPRC